MKLTFLFVLGAAGLALGGCRTAEAANRVTVDLDYVTERARELAAKPYDPKARLVPPFLLDLEYDRYRQIRFLPEEALWADEGLPFRVELFHPGYLYRQGVKLHEVTATHEQRIPFVRDFFDYGGQEELARKVDSSLDYAGFRVRHPLNERGTYDEFLVFLGASYFRLIGRAQNYGLSARALAIDMGVDESESFPAFRAFWLRKPAPDDRSLTIYALLDGASVTGAFAFVFRPGETTKVDVRGRIILREEVEVLGLAAFSSMFWYGENTLQRPPDWRPEVHDSDGLAWIGADGAHFWRPLANPRETRIDTFPADRLEGFGLLQRDRRFAAYEDDEAHYHRRPSYWIEPGQGMEEGELRLLEITTRDEYVDNIALAWEPTEHPAPGELFEFDYRLLAGTRSLPSPAAVVATRVGRVPGDPGLLEFVVDFAGEEAEAVDAVVPITAELQVEGGELVWEQVHKLGVNDHWRLHARVRPAEAEDVRLRARLLHEDETPLTETWIYRWTP
ncbi:MAG: glucan biosynthesis protein [Opitutales bacterium]